MRKDRATGEHLVPILRIEDKDGEGLYQSKLLGPVHGLNGWATPMAAEEDYAKHPLPMHEDEPGFDAYWARYKGKDARPRFGFTGWPQINAWFTPEELRRLAQRGAVIVLYYVPAKLVFVTRKQVCFEHREEFEVCRNPLRAVLHHVNKSPEAAPC